MGKIRKKRLKISRYSPINLDKSKSVHSSCMENLSLNNVMSINQFNVAPESSSMDEEIHQNGSSKLSVQGGLKMAHEKISSSTTEERMTGLNMLAALALDADTAEMIVQKNMVIFIAPLLKDGNSQVRMAASGALRNLCAWESDEVVDMMVQQEVLQPLSKLLKSYELNEPHNQNGSSGSYHNKNFSKGIANTTSESDPENLIFIHATNVMWSLCECNEEAIMHFNRDGLVHVLLKHMDPCLWGYDVALAAADCLFCVSENNPKVTSNVLPVVEELYSILLKSISSQDVPLSLHFSVVLCGILLNVNYWLSDDSKCCKLLEVLSKVLEVDPTSLLSGGMAQSPIKTSSRENFSHVISAQLIAFEILSNLCCPDDEDDWQDEESEEIDFEDCSTVEEERMEVAEETGVLTNYLSSQMVEGIKYFGIVQKIHQKLIDFDKLNSFKNQQEDAKDVIHKFTQLKVRGLQCLQNLINCLQVEDFGGPEEMVSTWKRFGQVFYSNLSEMSSDEQEALSGVMRASIEKLSSSTQGNSSRPQIEDLQMIISSGSSCSNDSVRANMCRMVGSLGCSFFREGAPALSSDSPDARDLLTQIVDYLLKVAQTDDILWVQAESLDVIIDLFSDDSTDALAARVRLVDRLKEISPQFKAKYNHERKKLGDHRPLVLTVKENLASFIKYKGQRLKSKENKH